MNVYRPAVSASCWLIGFAIFAYFGFNLQGRDWLETGFLALLPKEEQRPLVAEASARFNRLLDAKTVWLYGANSPDNAVIGVKTIEKELRSSGLFAKVGLGFDASETAKRWQRLYPYRYHLLDEGTRRLLADDPKAFLRQNLEQLYGPAGQWQSAALESDPLMLFGRYLRAQNPSMFTLQRGVPILRQGTKVWALLTAELADSRLPLDKLDRLLQSYRHAESTAKQAGGELLVTGLPLFTAFGAESAQNEISTVGVGSGIGIVLLFLFTFRSPRPLLLSALAIGAGLGAAWVVSIYVFGKIHIITLVFGASLIGVVDDYAQHYLCDSFDSPNWDPHQGLTAIFPALVLGLVSNLLSYAGLGLSPFPGLQEVALFSAVGLLAAWLTVVLLFPFLLTRFEFSHQPVLLKLAALWERDWPAFAVRRRKYILPLVIAVLIAGVWKLDPKDDVRLFQTAPDTLLRAGEKLKALMPLRDSRFFLVTGNDMASWQRNEQRLLEALTDLQHRQVLRSFEGLSRDWPDVERQSANYSLLKQAMFDSGLARQYMKDLGFMPSAIAETERFFAGANGNFIALESWLESVDESEQSLWLGCNDGPCAAIVALTGVRDVSALASIQLPEVSWVDPVENYSTLFSRYRLRASILLLTAFVLVWTGLRFKFGGRGASTIMAIPFFAGCSALAMAGWFGQLFSLFNLFALLLVLGIGVDYAAFFYLAGERRLSASLSVALSGLTTLLSFGLLALSSTAVVHAFGFMVAVGIVAAMLSAPLIGNIKSE